MITYISNQEFYPEGLTRQHQGDQGFDLKVCHLEPTLVIPPKTTVMVPLGVKDRTMHSGWYAALYARSSLQKRGLFLANGVGVIDQGYTGEIQAPLYNVTDEPVILLKGERICQLVFHAAFNQNVTQVSEFVDEEARGDAGFGSTGA